MERPRKSLPKKCTPIISAISIHCAFPRTGFERAWASTTFVCSLVVVFGVYENNVKYILVMLFVLLDFTYLTFEILQWDESASTCY